MRPLSRRRSISSWSSDFVANTSRNASTLSRQKSLPRLPIPDLKDTVQRYLNSLEPFYRILASRGGPSVEASRSKQNRVAHDFVQPGGLGEKLQGRLKVLDQKSPFNWLDDTIWTRVAYHEWRQPLLVHSNWWLLLQDDPTIPEDVRNIQSAPSGTTTPWQIRRAAWLTKRFLDYRDKLESQEIHPDTSRTGKWFREPALRLYGTTRIPYSPCDTLVNRSTPNGPNWVHVMFREWSYRVQVQKSDSERLSVREIEGALSGIVDDVHRREAEGVSLAPVARLTADHRDVWAKNRQHLLELSPRNRVTAETLESTLFTVCLDDYTHPDPPTSVSSEHAGHIRNTASGIHAKNRWFDKSMSLILESNGRFGMMGEHSPVDALIPSIIADWAISEPIDPVQFEARSGMEPAPFEALDWDTDAVLVEEFDAATERARAVIGDSDPAVLWFRDYGVDWIKHGAKLSPDAYVQMALQLAWYKLTDSFTATYETASTRLFLHGRTETIRTLSSESMAFVDAMVDPTAITSERHSLLAKACATHTSATKDAALGRGIDRHLFGLRLQMQDGESSEFFDDELFALSQEWKLSTSGLSAGDRFLATGFGAAYPDGCGINYLTGRDVLKFGVETKKSGHGFSSGDMMQAINESLCEMRELCTSATIQNTLVDARL